MYKNVKDPWNQSLTENIERSLSRQAIINFIKQNDIQSLVEFGCGLGNTTQFLHSKTGIEITGIDISKSAIKKSQKKYPDLSFKVDNALNIANYAHYDCFF